MNSVLVGSERRVSHVEQVGLLRIGERVGYGLVLLVCFDSVTLDMLVGIT